MNEQNIPQPNESVQSSKPTIWITIMAVIITALVVGGGVYAWQKSNLLATEQSLQQRISDLQNQITNLQKPTQPVATTSETPQEPATTSADATTNWQTYSSSKYGFEIKYPKTWRKGGDEDMAYIAGNWYTLKPGSSILLCFPPNGCQDSTIRISVIEDTDVDSIVSLLTENDQMKTNIEESKFMDINAKTVIFSNEWKEIIFQRNNITYILSGTIESGTPEYGMFEKIISTLKFTK